jgi:diacylglycerol kinase family enzyme
MARSRRALRGLRRWLPRLHLPLATAFIALTSRSYVRTLRIACDGTSVVRRTPGLFVVNQARISRDIDLEWNGPDGSGRFRVIVLRDLGRLRLLATLARLFLRKRLGAVADAVEVFDTRRLAIEAEDGAPLRFSADGEPGAEAARLDIREAPVPLRVYRVPAP